MLGGESLAHPQPVIAPPSSSVSIFASANLEETMLRKVLVAAATAALLATAASAQGQFGTATEAKAMLEKAVGELKSNEAAALAKFNKGEGGFKDRDLY